MSGFPEFTLAALGGLLSIPAATFCAQSLLARWLPEPEPEASTDAVARPSVAVIMPAHNETGVIAASLRSILPQLLPGERLLVVADNCTDNTAAIAHALGAEVAIRDEPQRRGKGYALDYGLARLGRDVPEVVIFMDADCTAAPGAIERLARQAWATGRPAQAAYRMLAPAEGDGMAKLAEFAWLVRNVVRPLGWSRLGLPCQLMGAGMAVPHSLLPGLALANEHIVEDMQLGVDLAVAGYPPVFCPAAAVFSRFPETSGATASQRTRWEHGHLGMILNGVPRLLGAAARRGDGRLLAMALDLAVPPLALLTLLAAGLAFFGLSTAADLPLLRLLAVLPLALLGLGVVVAWRTWGRALLSLPDLLMVIPYAAGKLPMYLRFVFNRQHRWVKTPRD